MVINFSSILLGLLLLALHVALCIWVYRDILRNGNSYAWALGSAIVVWLFPILGFIVYLALRKHMRFLHQ